MELFQAYEKLKHAKGITEVLSILRELKATYTTVDIHLIPMNLKDPLSDMYKLTVKLDKDGWFLPIGKGTYDILKEVL